MRTFVDATGLGSGPTGRVSIAYMGMSVNQCRHLCCGHNRSYFPALLSASERIIEALV